MDNRSIGFFDSGVGGLTTLNEVVKIMPHENYVYFADNANSPFGNKSKEQILTYAQHGVEFLMQKNVKAIIFACNTATKICANKLRERYNMQIFGIEPAIKPAFESGKKTLILTTKATAHSDDFKILLGKFGENCFVLACESLASYIENNLGSAKLYSYAQSLLEDARIDTYSNIVLGCTHYVFLKDMIQQLYPCLNVLDGNTGLAKHVCNSLQMQGMLNFEGEGIIDIYTSAKQNISYYDIIKFYDKYSHLCQ